MESGAFAALEWDSEPLTSLEICAECGGSRSTCVHITKPQEDITDMTDDAIEITEDERGAIPEQLFDINEVTTKRLIVGVRTLAGIEEAWDGPTLVERVQVITKEEA